MSFRDFSIVLRQQLRLIAFAGSLGILCGLAIFLGRPVEYSATVPMYVSAQVGRDATSAYEGSQLAQQRVKSYAELVTGLRVSGDTIARLGLTTTPDNLSRQISSTNNVDSLIIDVSVTDRSPIQAAQIANAVAESLTTVVDELERPGTPDGIAPVSIKAVMPAPVPLLPSSPGLLTNIVGGLVLGLLVGVLIAWVREVLDNSIKRRDRLGAAIQAPILGVFPFEQPDKMSDLVRDASSESQLAEAYRQIRTSLSYIDVDSPPKVVVVTSPRPGDGKTTTVANLATAVASSGMRVLAIEADLRRPRLARLLGLPNAVGLTTVLTGRLARREAVQSARNGLFDVIASGSLPPNPSELVGSRSMEDFLDKLRKDYDYIFIDSPPLLPVTDSAALAAHADGVVLVVRYDSATEDQAEAAAESIRSVGSRILGGILAMVPASGPYADSLYGKYVYYRDSSESSPNQVSSHSVTKKNEKPIDGNLESPTERTSFDPSRMRRNRGTRQQ